MVERAGAAHKKEVICHGDLDHGGKDPTIGVAFGLRTSKPAKGPGHCCARENTGVGSIQLADHE